MTNLTIAIAMLTILGGALVAMIALFGALYVQIRNELSGLTHEVGKLGAAIARIDEKLTSHVNRITH